MKKLKISLVISILLLSVLFAINFYNAFRSYQEKQTRFLMDTYVSISAAGSKKTVLNAVNLAFERLQDIDVKFNSLNPKSPLYAFNQAGEAISDPEILGLVNVAQEVSRESGGAFDITVEPLIELWGFYGRSARLPQDSEIKACLDNVGYKHLLFFNGRLEKDDPDVRVGLGGIAKGYAIAEAVKVLRSQGVVSALINAGGDLYALGKNSGKKWRVGIRNPRKEEFLAYVDAEDAAVIGSGDYERFFIQDAKKYHHIFDPRTGYPTEGVAGVTIIYPDPVLAQAWAKIPFVMGAKEGLKMLEKIPGMKAIVVTSSGEILYSPGTNLVSLRAKRSNPIVERLLCRFALRNDTVS